MNQKRILWAAAALCIAPAIAQAQNEKPKNPDNAGLPAKSTVGALNQKQFFVCTSDDLLGMEVRNPQGEKLGKIEDVVFASNGQVAYAVLSFGGTLGLGDKLFAIPWNVMQTTFDPNDKDKDLNDRKRYVVLSIPKDRLKAAPGFDKNNWPNAANDALFNDVDKYYASDRNPTATEASARVVGMPHLRVTKFEGTNVETPTGDKLGDVKEVVLDPITGRVNYVALSVGGFLGLGDRVVAVPWESIKMTRINDKEKFTLATTKEKLEKAPEFHAGQERWREMSDPMWIGRVYDYYSVRPYWDYTPEKRDNAPTEPPKKK